jgi:hypothetical protein
MLFCRMTMYEIEIYLPEHKIFGDVTEDTLRDVEVAFRKKRTFSLLFTNRNYAIDFEKVIFVSAHKKE